MPWVAYSDNCSRHPKISGLTDREFRVWFRTNEYCQEYRTNGIIRHSALTEIKDLTAKITARLATELWHEPGDMCDACRAYYTGKVNGTTAYVVHEFWVYNPDDIRRRELATERQRARRERDDSVTGA